MFCLNIIRFFVFLCFCVQAHLVYAMDDQEYLELQGNNVPTRIIRRYKRAPRSPAIVFEALTSDEQEKVVQEFERIYASELFTCPEPDRAEDLKNLLEKYKKCPQDEYISIIKAGTMEAFAELVPDSAFLMSFIEAKLEVLVQSKRALYIQQILAR